MTKNEKYSVCQFMYDNNLSLRKTCKEYSISKTRLYEFIKKDLNDIDYDLYTELCVQLGIRRKRG